MITYRHYRNMATVPASYLEALYRLTLPKGLMRGRAERARLRGSPGVVAIAFNGSHPIGWNLVDYQRVVNQFVHPKYRGCGIGGTLLKMATEAAGIKLTRKCVYADSPEGKAALKALKRARSMK